MQFRSALGALALLLAGADARITGMSIPKTIKPDEEFMIELDSITTPQEDWVMSVAFGYEPVATAKEGSLGSMAIGYNQIKIEDHNLAGTIPVEKKKLPAGLEKGEYVLVGINLSLRDKMRTPHVEEFRVTFTVGDATSEEYIKSPGEEGMTEEGTTEEGKETEPTVEDGESGGTEDADAPEPTVEATVEEGKGAAPEAGK